MAVIVGLSIIAILVISLADYAQYKYNRAFEDEEKLAKKRSSKNIEIYDREVQKSLKEKLDKIFDDWYL